MVIIILIVVADVVVHPLHGILLTPSSSLPPPRVFCVEHAYLGQALANCTHYTLYLDTSHAQATPVLHLFYHWPAYT